MKVIVADNLHNLIKKIICEVLRSFDIESKEELLNIDVLAKKDDEIYTIEIDTRSDKSRIINNYQKCLFINPHKHIHIIFGEVPEELIRSGEKNNKIQLISCKFTLRISKGKNKYLKQIKKIEKKPISTKEKIKIWKKLTGLSRTSYFFYKAKLLGKVKTWNEYSYRKRK